MINLIYTNNMGDSLCFGSTATFLITEIDGLGSPENEIYTQKTVNQDGVTVTDSTLKQRNIVLEGKIIDSNRTNRQSYRQRLLKLFNPKLDGKLTIEWNDLKREIECKPEKAPYFASKDNQNFQDFYLSLLCPDPYFKDIRQDSIDLVTWIENLEFTEEGFGTEQGPNYWLGTEEGSFGFEEFMSEFGLGQAKTFGYRELKQIIEIDNTGDADTPIKVIFKADGDVVNPFIQNILTYDKVQIKGTLHAGDELIITTGYGDKNVYLNGAKAQQYYDFLNSEWLQLQPGINLIKYDAQEGINNLECRILYTSKYLGV